MKNSKNIFKLCFLVTNFLIMTGLCAAASAPSVQVSTYPGNSGIEVMTWNLPCKLQSRLKCSSHGAFLAYVHDDFFELFDLENKRYVGRQDCGEHVYSINFSPDGKFFVIGLYHGFRLWNVKAVSCVHEHKVYGDNVRSVKFSPDGRFLLVQLTNGFRLWDLKSKKCVWARDFRDELLSIKFSPNGKFLLIGDRTGFKLLDIESRECAWGCECGRVNRIKFSPNSGFFVTNDYSVECKLWDVCKRVFIGNFSGADGKFLVKFSPDGKYLIIAGLLCGFKGYDTSTGELIYLYEEKFDIFPIKFSSGGKVFLTGKFDGFMVWLVEDGECLFECDFKEQVYFVSFSRDCTKIIVALKDRIIIYTDLLAKSVLPENKEEVLALAQASLSRLNQKSNARFLTQNDLQLIYNMIEDMAGVTPWVTVFER